MTIWQLFKMLSAFANIHLLKRRIPLFISWNITFKCNLNCMYCGTHDIKRAEWGTREVTEGLDTLWNLGSRWITFGGGEPLVREDIGHILRYAKRRGFQVYLSTNGALAPEKVKDIETIDHVNLSIDGEREVHDVIRGKGSFDKAVEAISVFTNIGIPVSLLCVLSNYNLDQVQKVLGIAARHHLLVMFQPAMQLLNSSSRPNPICPPVEAYRQTISALIGLKKQGAPIRNSFTGLRHLAHWPDSTRIWCPAGILISVIEPDGSVLACHLAQEGGFRECLENRGPLIDQFKKLPPPSALLPVLVRASGGAQPHLFTPPRGHP